VSPPRGAPSVTRNYITVYVNKRKDKKMKIIEPSFEILTPFNEGIFHLEACARTCYKSESDGTQEKAKDLIRKIMKRGHESVIEHVSMSVRIVCDRGVSHEIVRHRLASYSQESTRYCNYGKEDHIKFIKPCFFPELPIGVCVPEDDYTYLPDASHTWLSSMFFAEKDYNKMLENGCSPQEARSVLPNSLKTEIVMTANCREWRHFFRLRTAKAAHPQMREIARPMLDAFKNLVPVLFDDINYE